MFSAERKNYSNNFASNESAFAGLEGTAFDIGRQLELLTQTQDIDSWCLQTQKDLEFLYTEFLVKLKVIPFDEMTVAQTENGPKLFCPKYKKFLLDTISWEERNGSTRFTAGLIHEYLIKASAGSMAAFVSPAGWCGLKDSQGRAYGVYPDTQIYMYKKKEGGVVEAITFVVSKKDMSLEKCEDYLRYFGKKINVDTRDEKIRIEDIVTTPLFFSPEANMDFVDLAYAISDVSGSDVSELLYQLENKDSLSQINHQRIFGILENFQAKVKEKVTDISDTTQLTWLKQFLVETVLDMSAASRGVSSDTPKDESFYRQEVKYFQDASQEGPCPLTNVTQSVGTPRLITGRKEILKCVRCPQCGKTVDAEIYDGKIHCPSCGASKTLN